MEISAKKNRLRVERGTRSKNARPVEPHRPSDQDTKTTATDWVSASSFANNDARLVGMLRSKDAQQIALAVNEILDGDEYGFKNSLWNRNVVIVDFADMPKYLGKMDWDKNMLIRRDRIEELKLYIHEDLHSRSALYFEQDIFAQHRSIEEGTIEYMTQQICEKYGVAYGKSYPDYVNAIKYIRRVTNPLISEYDFAKKMFDLDMPQRYNYLAEEVERYSAAHPTIRAEVRARLYVSLRTLAE